MHSLPNVKSSLSPSIHLLQKCRRLARMLRIKRVHFMHETFNSPSCSKWIKMKVMKRYAKVEKFWNSRKRIQGCFVFCRLHKSSAKKYELLLLVDSSILYHCENTWKKWTVERHRNGGSHGKRIIKWNYK